MYRPFNIMLPGSMPVGDASGGVEARPAAVASVAPQDWQKRAVLRFSAPHWAQIAPELPLASG
jgi:hypothetical protein